ncbi:MAG: hypothetical protein JW894_09335, partial [Bacteroidales bacterium]|nr:hypothetical protein [Bacteroidales bacterium]
GMKNLKYFSYLFCMLIVSISCKKDDPEIHGQREFENNYFSLPNSIYVAEEFPVPSYVDGTVSITNISGNESVLPGGSIPVTITFTSDQVYYLLVGLRNVYGYMKMSLNADNINSLSITVFLIMGQDFNLENSTLLFAVIDKSGYVSSVYTLDIHLVEAGTGLLQVSCAWDQLNDVDLHLIEPTGEEIYYDHRISLTGGNLDIDSNAGCTTDGINNENITYDESSSLPVGTYTVRVDLWSACLITAITNFTATVWLNGVLITPSTGTNPFYGQFEPYEEDFGEAGDGITVMTFDVTPSMMEQAGVKIKKVCYIKYPNNENKVLSPSKVLN